MENPNDALLRVFSALRFMGMDPNYMAHAGAAQFAHLDNPGQVPYQAPAFGHTSATVDNPMPPLPAGLGQPSTAHVGAFAHLANAIHGMAPGGGLQGSGTIERADPNQIAGFGAAAGAFNQARNRPQAAPPMAMPSRGPIGPKRLV